MENIFIKISDLKSNAGKRAYNSQSNSGKIVKQIIGLNPLNKEMVDEAKSKLKSALKNHDFRRIHYLIQCLDILYYCCWVLKNQQSNNQEITKMAARVETLYINSCINYIEQNIHTSNKILSLFNLLSSAIEVVLETNQVMGKKYLQMLSRYNSLHSTFLKITDLCQIPNSLFTKQNTQSINTLMTSQEGSFKVYPHLKENIIDIITNKLDIIHNETQKKIEKIITAKEPSICKLEEIIYQFVEVYRPIGLICHQKRFSETLDKYEQYSLYKKIITEDYAKWVKLYQYYSLPRNKINEKILIETIKEMEENNELFNQKYIEIRKLDPPFFTLKSFFINLINQQGNDNIINYYKIENELLNTQEGDKKIEEIVRFIKHINEKLSSIGLNVNLNSELIRIKNDFHIVLDNSIEKKIKSVISIKNHNSLIQQFDKILSYLYELNDINKINYWQNIKKILFKGIIEIPEIMEKLQSMYTYMNQTIESKAKETLKRNILESIRDINEVLTIMAVYQMDSVQNYLKIISKIENDCAVAVHKIKKGCGNLVILDKYTAKKIVIFSKTTVNIGRNEITNDIALRSEWVSNNHCILDFSSNLLVDNNSTNGTFLINSKERINKHKLDIRCNFNIAQAFEFLLERFSTYSILKIVKILDPEIEAKDLNYIQSLLKTDFVCMKKYGEIAINTITGKINSEGTSNEKDLIIIYDDNFSILDKENAKSKISLNENEEINTDRFSICLN